MNNNSRKETKGGCGSFKALMHKCNLFSIKSILVITFFIGLDFFVKLIVENIKPDIHLFSIFSIKYTTNTGIAFGFFKSNPNLNALLVLVILSVFLYLFCFNKNILLEDSKTKKNNKIPLIAVILILSGGISNLIDRLIYGYVIDFISIGSWPNFNLADSYITIGVIMMILFIYSSEQKKKK